MNDQLNCHFPPHLVTSECQYFLGKVVFDMPESGRVDSNSSGFTWFYMVLLGVHKVGISNMYPWYSYLQ